LPAIVVHRRSLSPIAFWRLDRREPAEPRVPAESAQTNAFAFISACIS